MTASQLLEADQVVVLDKNGQIFEVGPPSRIMTQIGTRYNAQHIDVTSIELPPGKSRPRRGLGLKLSSQVQFSAHAVLTARTGLPKQGHESLAYKYYASKVGWLWLSIFAICLCSYSSGLNMQGKILCSGLFFKPSDSLSLMNEAVLCIKRWGGPRGPPVATLHSNP